MMRMMSFAVGLPQLVWVAVYGAAAFFLFYYGRKLDLSLPLLNVSLYRALIMGELIGSARYFFLIGFSGLGFLGSVVSSFA